MANSVIERVFELSKHNSDAVAIQRTTDQVVWSRGELLDEARRLGACLDATTPQHATIAVESHADNGADFIASLLAIWGSGRRALPLAAWLPKEEVVTLLEAHVPAAVIGTSISHPNRLNVDFGAPGARSELDAGEHASLLLQSSGTVGRARVALREAKAINRVGMTLLRTICVDEHDHVLSSLPMHHAYGIEHAVLLPMMAGARISQMPVFEIDVALEYLSEGANVLPAIPPTIDALASTNPVSTPLRLVYTAGSPLPTSTRVRFEEAWGVKVGDLYGASEVGTITWGFHGIAMPVPGVEVKLAPDGELMVRSDAMFSGYLDKANQPVDTERIPNGWFLTGDLASIGPNNAVQLIGRARLQFDVGGLKVQPTDVEEALIKHTEIAEVLVGPLVLSETVNRVHAQIVPAAGIPETNHQDLIESITQFAREHLPPHQVPRQIEVVESLPRTPSGKLIRRQASQE